MDRALCLFAPIIVVLVVIWWNERKKTKEPYQKDVILPKSSRSFEKSFIPNVTQGSAFVSAAGTGGANPPQTIDFTPMTKIPLSLYNDG